MPRQSRRLIAGTFVIVLALALLMSVTACGSSTTLPDANPATVPAQTQTADPMPSPDALPGVWVSEGDVPFEATITADTIVVKIVDGETKSLFWKGTFPATAQKGDILLSDADVEALASSMMGSSELVKPFTYEGDEILFEFSMMGTSTVIHVKK